MTPEKLDELERLIDDAAGEAFLPEGWRRIVNYIPDLIAAARREAALREAWDAVSAAIDDTHPEGHGCDLCNAADEMDALLSRVPQ